MSRSVQDILKIYRGRQPLEEKIPSFTIEDVHSLKEHPVFRALMVSLDEAIRDADEALHEHVKNEDMVKASQVDGVITGMTNAITWLIDVEDSFKDKEQEES